MGRLVHTTTSMSWIGPFSRDTYSVGLHETYSLSWIGPFSRDTYSIGLHETYSLSWIGPFSRDTYSIGLHETYSLSWIGSYVHNSYAHYSDFELPVSAVTWCSYCFIFFIHKMATTISSYISCLYFIYVHSYVYGKIKLNLNL